MNFIDRYGSWALVAGASEGLGAEFARQLAQRGLNVVLVARRAVALEALAAELKQAGVQTRVIVADLARAEALATIISGTRGLEVGLMIYNAAFTAVGPFIEGSIEDSIKTIDVNVRGPLVLAHHFGHAMASRKRGGLIFMSSLTAFQGSPYVAVYGATKAFNLTLAEGLWYELRGSRVDVLSVCAGATKTPGLLRGAPNGAPGMLEPGPVVRDALNSLGRKPTTIAGKFNRAVSFLMRRLLPRRTAIALMGDQTKKLRH